MKTQQIIDELQTKIDGLKAKLKEENEPMFDEINNGDEYYYLDMRFNIEGTTYNYPHIDDKQFITNNAFKDKKQAQACADYLKDRFWFIRKAIEFADGYVFDAGTRNYYVYYEQEYKEWKIAFYKFLNNGSIYMTKSNAFKFKDWLNKHKPESF